MFYFQIYLECRKMKISFEQRYFSFNRIVLLTIGLWPYHQTKIARFQVAIFLGILISFIAFQVQQLSNLFIIFPMCNKSIK
jgi:hypothetical protein